MTVPRRFALVLVAALVLGACIPQPTTPQPSPSSGASATVSASASAAATVAPVASDMSATLLAKSLPEGDIFDLTRRMRGRDGQPAAEFLPARAAPPV